MYLRVVEHAVRVEMLLGANSVEPGEMASSGIPSPAALPLGDIAARTTRSMHMICTFAWPLVLQFSS